jgi:hypothetical protein
MTRTKRRSLAVLAAGAFAFALVGCEHQYVYQPVVSTSAAVAGRPASYYTIPPEAPRGDVRIATFGFVDIHPRNADEGAVIRGLHVRMIVANNSNAPWTVDTRDQMLSLPGRGESRPAFVTVDAGASPPTVVVPSGEKRTVDLFYPLPPDLQKAEKVPAFDTVWRVDTGVRVVVERTPFERLEVEPSYPYDYGPYDYAYTYGWGPNYWYDPYYGSSAFVGVQLAPVYVRHPVIIRHEGVIRSAPPAHRR